MMLKRIMMIPISLAAAGGIPFLALNRDLATRFEAAFDELTVPTEEAVSEPLGDESAAIPSRGGRAAPTRPAAASAAPALWHTSRSVLLPGQTGGEERC